MLLQTNSYVVPREKRVEHARLMKRFKQIMLRLGCGQFEVYEQAGPAWIAARSDPRCIQILRFRERRQQQALQEAERTDPAAQELVREFCELIGLEYQLQQGLFFTNFYSPVIDVGAEPEGTEPGGAPATPEPGTEKTGTAG